MSSNSWNPNKCDCSACHVLTRSDWAALRPAQLNILSSGVRSHSYNAGEAIYSMGDPNNGVYCISGGSVGIRKMDKDGNAVLLHLAYPGDTFGYRSFLLAGEHQTSAEALGPTYVCHVPAQTVSRILAEDPAMGLQFLRRASRETEDAHDAIVRSATLTSRQRFAHLLLVLARQHGKLRTDGSHTIELPLSRRDIASAIGTRHETLSRIIGRLEQEGIANFSGRRIRLPRLDALVRELDPVDQA